MNPPPLLLLALCACAVGAWLLALHSAARFAAAF